jgi:hypothetical protein
VSGQLHASAALTPRNSSLYLLDRRLGEPLSLSGQYGELKKMGACLLITPHLFIIFISVCCYTPVIIWGIEENGCLCFNYAAFIYFYFV